MLNSIAIERKELNQRYYNESRHTIQIDFIPYLDDIADMIGVKPNLVKLFLFSPYLWWAVMFGPGVPYQYRLTGLIYQ